MLEIRTSHDLVQFASVDLNAAVATSVILKEGMFLVPAATGWILPTATNKAGAKPVFVQDGNPSSVNAKIATVLKGTGYEIATSEYDAGDTFAIGDYVYAHTDGKLKVMTVLDAQGTGAATGQIKNACGRVTVVASPFTTDLMNSTTTNLLTIELI
jgi:hypothetical protein